MTVRRAVVDDADGMAIVAVEAWRWAYAEFMPPDFLDSHCDPVIRAGRMRDRWEEFGRNWVATNEGEIVGFASERKPPQLVSVDCELGALYVHPDHTRSGIGRALVAELLSVFASERCHSMGIHTLVDNRIGCRFYEKIGGRRDRADGWNGFEGIWFVWDDLPQLRARLDRGSEGLIP